MHLVIRKGGALAFDIPSQGNHLVLIINRYPRSIHKINSTFTVEPSQLHLTRRIDIRKQMRFSQVVVGRAMVTKLAISPTQTPYRRGYVYLDPGAFGGLHCMIGDD